jgi:hypothetical protein
MDFHGSVLAFPRQGGRIAEHAIKTQPNKESREEADATQDDAAHHPLSSWVQTAETATSLQGEERIPREEPPPGEERPERRGSVPTTPPTGRENPPPGRRGQASNVGL